MSTNSTKSKTAHARVREMMESVAIVRWCLDSIEPGPVIGDVPKVIKVPPGESYVGIENPRGELGHYVHSDGGKVAVRCRVLFPLSFSLFAQFFSRDLPSPA